MQYKIIGERFVCGDNPSTKKFRCGTVIHTTYHEEHTDGTSVKSFWVSSKVCSPEKLILGNFYEITISNNYVNKVKECKNND